MCLRLVKPMVIVEQVSSHSGTSGRVSGTGAVGIKNGRIIYIMR